MGKSSVVPEKQIQALLGKRAEVWRSMRTYLKEYYPGCEPIYALEGRNKEDAIRYRKSGRTLVTLYPRQNDMVVLVVLGKKEVVKADALAPKLNSKIRKLLMETEQLHDGRWLWIRASTQSDVESIKLLLSTKRRPKPPS